MKTVKTAALALSFIALLGLLGMTRAGQASSLSENRSAKIVLTETEKRFLQEHPVIRLGVDPTFEPYEFFDSDGVYKGMAADYIDLICGETGLKMIPEKGLTWVAAYDKAVNRELDVLPCVANTRQRQNDFLFSDAYLDFQRAIFLKVDNSSVRSIGDLSGKAAAVQTNSSHQGFLTSSFPAVIQNQYPNVDEALKAVSGGRELTFIGNLATTSYLIKALGITNLKYIPIESRDDLSLRFAVRTDWPELVGILNKALASVTKEKKIAINNKWLGVQAEADYSQIIRIAQITGAVFLIILTVSGFWIIRLRREIKKRRKAQEELRLAKEEAERANQVKSLFLARMSHEVRTPLHAIMGMAFLFKKTEMTDTQTVYLDKLTQAARNMLGIINDILDFSKIEAGKVEIEKIPFDLDALLQRVLNIAAVPAAEQGIELILRKAPDMPASFIGDPTRLEQVLLNILSNAVKFTSAGGVTLTVGIGEKKDGPSTVEFNVQDTGIGMTEAHLNRLFIPFDQGDSAISRRYGGTGLGMSIVKNLVDLMGGTIVVTSVPDKGTTFIVRLPLEAEEGPVHAEVRMSAGDNQRMEAAGPKPPAKENPGAGLSAPRPYHILIVEDNRTNQFIARSILEQAGFIVSQAEDGGGGVLFVRENLGRIDLILMDIHMPDMDGYTASDLIREIDPGIPIVAVTADAVAGIAEQCARHGMAHWVSKPFEPDELVRTLVAILGSGSIIPAPDRVSSRPEDSRRILNAQDGLRRIGGDRELYRLILQEYLRENLDVLERLKETLALKDYPASVQIVHKIKSSSGNIGAGPLYEAASRLQKSLPEGAEAAIAPLFEDFSSLFVQLTDEISQQVDLPEI